MHLGSTVSLVDHLQTASTLPTQDLCALYLHTPHERPWLVTPEEETAMFTQGSIDKFTQSIVYKGHFIYRINCYLADLCFVAIKVGISHLSN